MSVTQLYQYADVGDVVQVELVPNDIRECVIVGREGMKYWAIFKEGYRLNIRPQDIINNITRGPQ